MRSIIKFILLITGISFLITACDKVDQLPNYGTGTAPVLTASTATIAPVAADSDKVALTLNWTYPNHATDSSNIKYTIEIDTSGKNFSKASSKVVIGKTSATFTAKELNNILLGYGYPFNVPVDMDVRVISSYANNNERLASNTLKIRMTPYKIPPKVALPTTNRLFIVGDATDFGWDNSASMPSVRELTRLDETTWAGIFHLSGGGGYLLLPQAGDWGNKFSVANNTIAGLANGGDFGFNLNDNIPGNVSGGNGWYRLVFNFQTGKFTATKVNNALPSDLYITGDATAGGWSNTPPANQKFTQKTNGVFEITMPFTPGKYYKFLSSSGNWQPQFGGSSATGGALGANYGGGQDPDAVPTPATAGNYKVTVNFLTNTYTVN